MSKALAYGLSANKYQYVSIHENVYNTLSVARLRSFQAQEGSALTCLWFQTTCSTKSHCFCTCPWGALGLISGAVSTSIDTASFWLPGFRLLGCHCGFVFLIPSSLFVDVFESRSGCEAVDRPALCFVKPGRIQVVLMKTH